MTNTIDTDLSGTVTEVRSRYLTVKWLYQRNIVLFTISGPLALREVVDEWSGHVRRIAQQWPSDRRYLAVHDISKANFRVTPHLVSAIRDLYTLRPELRMSIAIVTPRNLATQLVRVLIRGYERDDQVNNGIFFSREEALRWLLSNVEDINLSQKDLHA